MVTVDGARGDFSSEISSKERDIRGTNVQERISGNQGILVISDFQKDQIAGDKLITVHEMESNTDLESIGLVVTDPK